MHSMRATPMACMLPLRATWEPELLEGDGPQENEAASPPSVARKVKRLCARCQPCRPSPVSPFSLPFLGHHELVLSYPFLTQGNLGCEWQSDLFCGLPQRVPTLGSPGQEDRADGGEYPHPRHPFKSLYPLAAAFWLLFQSLCRFLWRQLWRPPTDWLVWIKILFFCPEQPSGSFKDAFNYTS